MQRVFITIGILLGLAVIEGGIAGMTGMKLPHLFGALVVITIMWRHPSTRPWE